MNEFGLSPVKTILTLGLLISMIGVPAFCDLITLKTGEKIRCTYLGGTSRAIRAEVGGTVKSYEVSQVATVSFLDVDSPASSPPVGGVTAPTARGVIPANTSITVRVLDPVDSKSARPGQTFRAATDEPLLVNGAELIPRDAPVQIRIVSDQITVGQATVVIILSSITINGKVVPIASSDVRAAASSSGPNQEAARIGNATSAAGGIIGALGGGRTVSTVGSAAGGAINTGNQLGVRGPRVRIPINTRLIFRTQSQVSF